MKILSRISPKVWLIAAYAILAAAFTWAGQQTEASVAGWVFFGCLAISWLPQYIYLNRKEIARQKALWFSHAAAGLVGVGIFVLWACWDTRNDSREQPGTWLAIVVSIITYMMMMQSGMSFTAWLVRKTQARVEAALESKQD